MKYTLKVGAFVFDTKQREKLLLIKEQYRKEDGMKWNIVKGTCDKQGETIEECVRREVREEAGLDATEVFLKGVFHYGSADDPKVLFIFSVFVSSSLVSIASQKEQARLNENISDFGWFTKKEFFAIPRESFMAPYIYTADPFGGNENAIVEISRA